VTAVFDGEGIRSYRRHREAIVALAKKRELEEREREQELHARFLSERDRLIRVLQDSDLTEKEKDYARETLSEVQAALNYSDENGMAEFPDRLDPDGILCQ
jgi:hypothetical protein